MREIKFRAWEDGKLLGYEFLDPVFAGWRHTIHGEDSGDGSPWVRAGTIHTGHDAKRDQYTGLKDKNGREIYEGDILRTPLNNGKYEVRWGLYRLGEYGRAEGPYFYRLDSGPQEEPAGLCPCYVIGNIYENPELLK